MGSRGDRLTVGDGIEGSGIKGPEVVFVAQRLDAWLFLAPLSS